MSEILIIHTADGDFSAYVARPVAKVAPAVLVLHEVFARHTGLHFNPAAAAQAYARTWRFLRESLARAELAPQAAY